MNKRMPLFILLTFQPFLSAMEKKEWYEWDELDKWKFFDPSKEDYPLTETDEETIKQWLEARQKRLQVEKEEARQKQLREQLLKQLRERLQKQQQVEENARQKQLQQRSKSSRTEKTNQKTQNVNRVEEFDDPALSDIDIDTGKILKKGTGQFTIVDFEASTINLNNKINEIKFEASSDEESEDSSSDDDDY